MRHAIHHGLGRPLARKATRCAYRAYKQRFARYNPHADWVSADEVDVSFSARGITVGGTIEITDEDVIVDLDVPLIFRPFKSKAIAVIDDEISQWIVRAKRGELDPG